MKKAILGLAFVAAVFTSCEDKKKVDDVNAIDSVQATELDTTNKVVDTTKADSSTVATEKDAKATEEVAKEEAKK
jgi:hypothetical protein